MESNKSSSSEESEQTSSCMTMGVTAVWNSSKTMSSDDRVRRVFCAKVRWGIVLRLLADEFGRGKEGSPVLQALYTRGRRQRAEWGVQREFNPPLIDHCTRDIIPRRCKRIKKIFQVIINRTWQQRVKRIVNFLGLSCVRCKKNVFEKCTMAGEKPFMSACPWQSETPLIKNHPKAN